MRVFAGLPLVLLWTRSSETLAIHRARDELSYLAPRYETPPSQGPPLEDPVDLGPTALYPPLEDPLTQDPPPQVPPLEDPPLEDTSTQDPPPQIPPLEDPPLEDPPLEDTSTQDPPPEDPPLEDPPTQDPSPTEADDDEATPTESTAQPTTTGLSKEEICKLEFETGDPEVAAKTWKDSGAELFLFNWMAENGAHDWESKLIQSAAGNGEGGSTIDCQNFPADNTCIPPQPASCVNFEEPAMFFIQLSMANLYGMFSAMHEAMQDYVLDQVTAGIKDVAADLAPPKAESQILTMLIGAFVTGAAGAGKFWQLGAPLTFAVGLFNLMAGGLNSQPPKLDANDSLESQLGKVFTPAQDKLEDSINGFFLGVTGASIVFGDKFGGLSIASAFGDGKFLDSKITRASTKAWEDAVTHQMTQGLAIGALKYEGWVVFIDTDKKDEDKCKDVPGAEWIDDECFMLAKRSETGGGDPFSTIDSSINLPDKELIEKLTGSDRPYEFDMNEFFRNAKDCNGGDFETSIPGFGEDSAFPKCFVNLEVKKAGTSPFYQE